MNKTFISKIKRNLEEEYKKLSERTQKDLNADIDIDGDDVDVIQAKIILLADTQIAVRTRQQLQKIENALSKITNGTFGDCEECGEPIAEKRLLINPSFITCIGCAEHLELIAKKNRL